MIDPKQSPDYIAPMIEIPQFEPPFESNIEEIFAWEISKHLKPDLTFQKQFEINTSYGNFRLDFLIHIMQTLILQ